MKPPIVVVGGPTASGKSKLATSIAKCFGGAILSADSVSVYDGCDILSAKPDALEQGSVTHELLSVFSPDEQFDVGQFVTRATSQISKWISAGTLPIICGGTGLYIRALLGGLVSTPEVSEAARSEVALREKELLSLGDEHRRREMHSWLVRLDPDRAQLLAPRDLVRIRRALLVALSSPVTLSEFHRDQPEVTLPWRVLVIALLPEREDLYRRINQRVVEMLDAGGIEEVRSIQERFGSDCPALQAIGYRHVAQFLRGECSREAMIDSLQRDTRRLAKRQFTWWRNEPAKLGWKQIDYHLMAADSEPDYELIICRFLDSAEPFGKDGVFYIPRLSSIIDK